MLKKKAYRTLWTLCLILAICFIINRPSLAAKAPHDFSIEVSYGYGNYQKIDRDMPIWVHITNRGAAFAGELTLHVNDGTYAGLTFSQHISVLSETEDEFVFYTPCLDSYTDITITLTEAATKEVTELRQKTLNTITSDIYLGILSDQSKSIKALTEELVLSSPVDATFIPVRSMNLSEHRLPETETGYNGFDIIVCSNFDASHMSEAQAEALVQWIKNGGIFLTGRALDMSGLFEKLGITPLAAEKTAPVTTDFEAAYQTYIHLKMPLGWEKLKENPTAKEIEDSRYYYNNTNEILSDVLNDITAVSIETDVMQSSLNNPFINLEFYQKLDLEDGRIVVSKFDFTSEAFTAFKGNRYVFQKMLADNITHADWTHFSNYSDNFRNVWSSQSLLLNTLYKKTPGLGKYIAILFIYILIIGPVLYIILKKTDKRYLLWIAVPAVTILFTVIIYTAGKDTRHSSPFINYASFIDGDNAAVSEDTFYSITMPDKDVYTQQIQDDYSLRLVNNNYFSGDSVWSRSFSRYLSAVNNNQGLSYINQPEGGTDISIDNTTLFSTRYFNLHKSDMDFAGLKETITYDNDSYTGTVENVTDYDIRNVCLIISGHIYTIGDIDAHSQISFDVKAKNISDDTDALEQEITNAINHSRAQQNTGEALVKTNMFIQFVNDTYNNGYPYLIGYMPNYRPEVFSDIDIPASGMTLYHKKAAIDYGHSDIYVPDIFQMMSVKSGEVYILSRELYSAETEVACNFDNRFIPETLSLTSADENLWIYAYNYAAKVYDPLFLDSKQLKTNIEDYFDENKILQLKFIQKMPYSGETYTLPVISAAGKVK